MSNLENIKLNAENLKREVAQATSDLTRDDSIMRADQQKESQLKVKIPQDEKELINEKQELRRVIAEEDRLRPKIIEEKRKQAKIYDSLKQITMEQNRALRDLNVRNKGVKGVKIQELKEKPRFGLN